MEEIAAILAAGAGPLILAIYGFEKYLKPYMARQRSQAANGGKPPEDPMATTQATLGRIETTVGENKKAIADGFAKMEPRVRELEDEKIRVRGRLAGHGHAIDDLKRKGA